MQIRAGRPVIAMTAGLIAAAALLGGSPAAQAEGGGGVPDPGPVPVVTEPSVSVGEGGCQAGETRDAENGNCVPAMTPVGSEGAEVSRVPAPTTRTGDATTESGLGTELVPNINGDPCTGYWESTACLVQQAPVVQPESTLSSSP